MATFEPTIEKDLLRRMKAAFALLRPYVIRPAKGFLHHDYLVPGGYYEEQWDWDGFFIGLHMLTRGHPQFLKYWALNYISAADALGFTPGCVTPAGPEPGHRSFQMKPFLAQGAWLAARAIGDISWVTPYFKSIVRICTLREKTHRDPESGLFFWDTAVQSGADDNPALSNEKAEQGAFLACDINAYQFREYRALARMADAAGRDGEAAAFRRKAAELADAVNGRLWSAEDETYWNLRRADRAPVRRVTFSNFIPLACGMAPHEAGRRMIQRYLWNEEHLLSPFGLRTLSRRDPDYTDENRIWPYSNWRGPIWPIANYLYFRALMNYGFGTEARRLAVMLAELCMKDLDANGSMHENYDADTGAPLAPTSGQRGGVDGGFIGWNLLVENMADEAEGAEDPMGNL
jgi:alpha,alpha-trehalase